MDHDSRLYRALRWCFQPLKAFRAACREWSYVPARRRLIAQHAGTPFAGLHIGCGRKPLERWINTDMAPNPHMDMPLDITRALPFPDAYFSAIYGQEVIEHVPLHDARTFFRQAARVLRPGGVLRLTTPDLEACARIYLNQHERATPDDYGSVWLEGEFNADIWLNSVFRKYGHEFIYSFDRIRIELLEAGFHHVLRCSVKQTYSKHPELGTLENRYGDDAPVWIWDQSMVLEAFKA